jgi:hypothetical protein
MATTAAKMAHKKVEKTKGAAPAVSMGLARIHDPLYRYHQWQVNLRLFEIQEITTVHYVPLSKSWQSHNWGLFQTPIAA